MGSFRFAATVLAAIAMLSCAKADEPVLLRMGVVVTPSNTSLIMFAKPGLAPHAGKTYRPDLVDFTGTASIVTGLAAGELDSAELGYSTFAIAVENAGLKDLRIVVNSFQDGIDGYHTNDHMVRNNSRIHTVEDLKGKILATNEAGSAIDMSLRAMLAKHNMRDKRDVTIIEVRFPDMKAMLKEGKVDLISAASPFDFDPELTSFARTLFTQKDGMGPTDMIVRVVRGAYLKEHRAAMVDFVEDYVRALHYLYDPTHRTEVIRLVSDLTKVKPEAFQDWLFTTKDYYRDPTGRPNLDVLQANIETQRELGFLKSDIDVKNYADLSLVEEAQERIAAESAK